MIISIEGPDFVGKNTLVKELISTASVSDLFEKKEFKILQFPNYETDIGKFLRKKLLDRNWTYQDGVIFQLLNTAHRYEYFSVIKRGKDDPNFVLFIIRYNLSGPVYASIDGLDSSKVWNLYAWFDELLPDITFIINREYTFDTLEKERDADHYESEAKQKKVKQIYALASSIWSDRLGLVIDIKNLEIKEAVLSMFEHLQEYMKQNAKENSL